MLLIDESKFEEPILHENTELKMGKKSFQANIFITGNSKTQHGPRIKIADEGVGNDTRNARISVKLNGSTGYVIDDKDDGVEYYYGKRELTSKEKKMVETVKQYSVFIRDEIKDIYNDGSDRNKIREVEKMAKEFNKLDDKTKKELGDCERKDVDKDLSNKINNAKGKL